MAVTLAWTSPTSSTLDKTVGDILPEALFDATASNLLMLGGADGTVRTGNLQISGGTVGIGATAIAQVGVYIPAALALSGSIQQVGVSVQPTFSSGTTLNGDGVYSAPATAAASFTCPSVASFHAGSPTKGAGSTITTAYGFLADAVTAGTNNYGGYIAAPSGGAGNNIGLRIVGGTPGLYIDAGGIIVAAGISQLAGSAAVGPAGSGYAGTGALRIASTQSICWRNSANSGDIVFGPDISDRLVFSGAMATTTTVGAAGGASALPATPLGYWPINLNGTNVKIPYYLP